MDGWMDLISGEVWGVGRWVLLLGGWVGMSLFFIFFLVFCWFEMDFVGGG